MPGTFNGYLLIADITGYTLYLTQSELEHAQGILSDLLKVLIEHTRPPLILSRLAGDAVISYALEDKFVQGQTFIEMIEDTYVAFRQALERMVLNNTCRCNACSNIANLDLKFFTHYGEFAVQRISDHDELVGSEVNLLHRLLKNQVVQVTGIRAYALYTQPVITRLGLQEICQAMTAHKEAYEHLGEVQVWIQDLQPIWTAKRLETRFSLPEKDIFLKWEIDIDLPPEKVWDYLSQPEFRKTLMGSTLIEVNKKEGGRITSGSVYHCFHGKQVVPQTVIEWQPFELMVTKDRLPVPLMEIYLFSEYRLVEIPSGTRFSQLMGKPFGMLPGRLLVERAMRGMDTAGNQDIVAFKNLIESDARFLDSAPLPALQLSVDTINQEVKSSLVEPDS